MNGHNITNESLALSMVLVLVAIVVSYREKLALEKDIIWSICRAIVQLIIVGYALTRRGMRKSAANISTKPLYLRLSR